MDELFKKKTWVFKVATALGYHWTSVESNCKIKVIRSVNNIERFAVFKKTSEQKPENIYFNKQGKHHYDR